MKNQTLFLSIPLLIIFASCNKEPFKPNYTNAGGYVIEREFCNINETEDYWLIDLTYYANTPRYGDTLILRGNTYTNVVKTKGLDKRLKQIGMGVSLDFKTVSIEQVEGNGCGVNPLTTYKLKELFIINQFEIR